MIVGDLAGIHMIGQWVFRARSTAFKADLSEAVGGFGKSLSSFSLALDPYQCVIMAIRGSADMDLSALGLAISRNILFREGVSMVDYA